jgi:tetratricopeptide (TPR) repeat protein
MGGIEQSKGAGTTMTSKSNIKAAFIFSQRADLVAALRTNFKLAGLAEESIAAGLDADECIERLRTRSDAVLCLDWEAGAGDALKILQSSRTDFKVDSRPTLLVAKDMSTEIVQIGSEFSVARVHIGEVSNTSIRILVKELLDSSTETDAVKDLLRQVDELRRAGQWEQATAVLERLSTKDPQNPRVAAEYAENLIRAEAWQSALNLLEPFSKIDSPDVRCLHLLGRCYLKLGRAGEATNLLSKAKLISPYNIERLLDLGQALLKIDQVEQAQEVFEEALDLDPSNKGAKQGNGQCKLLQGELNEGLQLIRSVSDNRELASIFNTTAVLTIHRNQHDRAMKLYDTAILAIGKDSKLLARLYYNKGIGFHRWTKTPEAMKCFQKALELDPGFIDASYNLKVLAKRGKGKQDVVEHQIVEKRTGTGPGVMVPGPAANNTVAAPTFTYDEIDADFTTDFSKGLTGEDESFF